MHLNTQDLINKTTGKNKSFLKRVAKHQEEKYGNVDIFSASCKGTMVEMFFGDYSITFFFRDGKVIDTLGNGQGHKYHNSLQACAEELHKQYIIGAL